jgi:hypothetical protein
MSAPWTDRFHKRADARRALIEHAVHGESASDGSLAQEGVDFFEIGAIESAGRQL